MQGLDLYRLTSREQADAALRDAVAAECPAAAGFFAAVFPANVKMAVDWREASPARRAVAYGRLPLQVPLVLWGLKVAREARSVTG